MLPSLHSTLQIPRDFHLLTYLHFTLLFRFCLSFSCWPVFILLFRFPGNNGDNGANGANGDSVDSDHGDNVDNVTMVTTVTIVTMPTMAIMTTVMHSDGDSGQP